MSLACVPVKLLFISYHNISKAWLMYSILFVFLFFWFYLSHILCFTLLCFAIAIFQMYFLKLYFARPACYFISISFSSTIGIFFLYILFFFYYVLLLYFFKWARHSFSFYIPYYFFIILFNNLNIFLRSTRSTSARVETTDRGYEPCMCSSQASVYLVPQYQ